MIKKDIQILCIDDDIEDYMLIEAALSESNSYVYHLSHVDNYNDASILVEQNSHDVYIVDYRLGGETGIDLIKRSIAKGINKPFILLTGQKDVSIDAEALTVGAFDYILKSNILNGALEKAIRYTLAQYNSLSQIRELNVSLEQKVIQRTSELNEVVNNLENTKWELSQALEQQKVYNELQKRFISTASHEFRTPLSTILSSVELIEKYIQINQLEQTPKHIDRIRTSVHYLTNLLTDVLTISKIEEGKVSVENTIVDLSMMLNALVEEFESSFQHTFKIQTSIQEHVKLYADKKLLYSILSNLLSNAIKYSLENKQIVVSLKTSIGDKVEVVIKDHGIGMSEEAKTHLFERFYRSEESKNIAGTGLGLNIVKNYVDLLKGEIHFTSELNKGTEVKLLF